MKILHVITSLRTGGAEKLMVDLLPRLKTSGLEVDLLLFDGVATPFRKEIEENGIKVFDFGVDKSVYSPMHIYRLMTFIRRYDIVHTHNTAPQLFVAIASLFASATLVTTEHNTSNRRRRWKWYTSIDRWMYKRYKKIICISDKAEENLREHISPCDADICTVNNGVDIARYRNATASAELDAIAPGSRKIVMVAAFRWEKDQDTLIRAMKLLPGHFHLFLIGDGVRRKDLERLTLDLELSGRVHILGFRGDIPQLLQAADYIVMSSHFEGLSLSSVEGMCVGKPFMASDVDGLREVVKDAGVLFPHEDAQTLASEILSLESNPEKSKAVAVACRRRAMDFDVSKMAVSYLNIYINLYLSSTLQESDKKGVAKNG